MVSLSPKQLDFSTPDGASHDTLSVRKSQRILASKRAASEEAGAEEKLKKDRKKRKVKKEKSASSVINRIWNSEDEVILLKIHNQDDQRTLLNKVLVEFCFLRDFLRPGLSDYKAERGMESKVEWAAFHPLVGDLISKKFSKEQVMSKIWKMKSRFLEHYEKIKQRNDSHAITFSNPEAYELATKIWIRNEAENDQDTSEENEEALDENETAENENTKEAQHSESGEEVLNEQNEVANAQQLNDNGAPQREKGNELLQEVANGAVKTIEKVIAEKGKASHDAADDRVVKPTEKEKHDAHVEFCNVQDAFDTLISHGLSDHRKRVQLEKLKKLGSGMRRKLSEEWTAISNVERKMKIRKFKFSATLAEAAKEN